MKKFFLIILIFQLINISIVFAEPVGFLTKDNGNNYYEYNYEELMESSLDNLIGDTSLLYNDYINRILVAFCDNHNGYVDSDAVMEKSLECLINGEKFIFDDYLNKEGMGHVIKGIPYVIIVKELNGKLIHETLWKIFDVMSIY